MKYIKCLIIELTIVATILLMRNTDALAEDDISEYIVSMIINMTSDEILNVKSDFDKKQVQEAFANKKCEDIDDVHDGIKCYNINDKYNDTINVSATFKYDEVSKSTIIYFAEIHIVDMSNTVGVLSIAGDIINEKLVSAGFKVEDNSGKYNIFSSSNVRSYEFINDNNYANGEIITKPCDHNSCMTIKYYYGLPNAVKKEEIKREIISDNIKSLVTTRGLNASFNNSIIKHHPISLNIKIFEGDKEKIDDTIIENNDYETCSFDTNIRIIELDNYNKFVALTYGCASGNRANSESLVLYNTNVESNDYKKHVLSSNYINIKRIDNDNKYYIIKEELSDSTGVGSEVITVPQIYSYINGKFINVTTKHVDYLDNEANKSLDRYKKSKNRGSLYEYIILKHLIGKPNEGWKQFDLNYKERDKIKLKKTFRQNIANKLPYLNKDLERVCHDNYCEYH